MHQLLVDSFWPLHKNKKLKKSSYFEVQNRISRSSGAQNDFISTGKARSEQKANSLHIECSCINWNLLISIILKTPDISFAPHTVMMSFCWPLLWKFFGKWRNALCNLLIRVIRKFSTRALQTYLTQNDRLFFTGSRLMLTCSINLHSNLIFKILIHVLLLVYGGATAKWQAWEKDLRTDQCCNELGGGVSLWLTGVIFGLKCLVPMGERVRYARQGTVEVGSVKLWL